MVIFPHVEHCLYLEVKGVKRICLKIKEIKKFICVVWSWAIVKNSL